MVETVCEVATDEGSKLLGRLNSSTVRLCDSFVSQVGPVVNLLEKLVGSREEPRRDSNDLSDRVHTACQERALAKAEVCRSNGVLRSINGNDAVQDCLLL